MPIKVHINRCKKEMWNEKENRFINIDVNDMDLVLEHSLISLSKWEAKWHKPFLDDVNKKSTEELLDYFCKMTIRPNDVDWVIFLTLTESQINEIVQYITEEQTATKITTFKKTKRNKKIITSEVIYYWMVAAQIPFECEKWHLSRLLKLIEIYGIENDPKGHKKMSANDIRRQNDAINEARKARLKTKG